jgi:DNA-binding NtrC family response regulator
MLFFWVFRSSSESKEISVQKKNVQLAVVLGEFCKELYAYLSVVEIHVAEL